MKMLGDAWQAVGEGVEIEVEREIAYARFADLQLSNDKTRGKERNRRGGSAQHFATIGVDELQARQLNQRARKQPEAGAFRRRQMRPTGNGAALFNRSATPRGSRLQG